MPKTPNMRSPVYKNIENKKRAYYRACGQGEIVTDRRGNKYPLSKYSSKDVECVYDCLGRERWYVKDKNDPLENHKKHYICGKCFVLLNRLQVPENNRFEFYNASEVMYDRHCWEKHGNWIVAKYATDYGVYWAYEETVKDASLLLFRKMYAESVRDAASHKNIQLKR